MKKIDLNFKEHANYLPQYCNIMQVLEGEGLTYVDSGLKVDTFNVIHIHNAEQLTQQSLEKAITFYDNRLRTSCIWMSDALLTDKVKDIFEKLNVEKTGINKGFWADIEQLQSNEYEEVQVVETKQNVIDSAFVIANNWDPFDINVLHYYNHVHEKIIEKSETIMLSYVVDKVVVGVIELFISVSDDSVAGIYNLSVMKDERKKGIGRKLVEEAINYAKNRNVKTFVTQASEDSESIFRNVGFTEEGKILEFAKK